MQNIKQTKQEYDLAGDVERIKAALWDASRDLQGTAGQMMNDSYHTFKEKAHEAQDSLNTYVNQNPLKAVGFAVLAGLVIGFLVRR